MSDELRRKLIRAAYENPRLKAVVLPLLKDASRGIYRGRPESWGLDSDYEGADDAAHDLTSTLLNGNSQIDKAGKVLMREVHDALQALKTVSYKHRDAGANAPDVLEAGRDAVEEYLQATFNEILTAFR